MEDEVSSVHAQFKLYLYSLLIEDVLLDVSINQTFWKSQSLNILFQLCSRFHIQGMLEVKI